MKNLRVLVTGDTGFKGSWLCEWLLLEGAEVFGLGLEANTNPSLFNQLGLQKRINHQDLDIRNNDEFQSYVTSVKPQIIFHLAAQPLVRYSYENPIKTYSTNVMGTVHLLNIIKLLPGNCVGIFITTDKCYENKEWIYSYRENDPLGGRDPYSSSKGCCELVINSFKSSYFNNPLECGKAVVSVRAGNVIGGGDWAPDRIIPDCIRHLQDNKPIPVRNIHATRPWQHVLEPLAGYLQLATELWHSLHNSKESKLNTTVLELSKAMNFGPELYSNRSVGDLVFELLKYYPGTLFDEADPKGYHEASMLNVSIDRAFHMLGWRPRWNFEMTISETVCWYKSAKEDECDVINLTQNQIRKYINND
ncbi:MAG: CDP-glucose 4,6-dehydratase [Opitutales bacterium]|nr:CDP-glucose 4,6-dehydratase [Opitutales bacterium]